MKSLNDLNRRDLERLSAYLDGELSPKESAVLEGRFKIEPKLKEALNELAMTTHVVSTLPQVRVPRNFTLTPEMVGIREKKSIYPVFRFATVVAAVAFAVLVGTDALFLRGMSPDEGLMFGAAPEIMLEDAAVQGFEVDEAPAEAPAAIEGPLTPTAEPNSKIIVEGEAEQPLAEPLRMGDSEETPENGLEKIESSQTDQGQNGTILPPEGTGTATGESMGEEVTITEADEPQITDVPTLSRAPTELPGLQLTSDEGGWTLEPIQVVELGLGVLALVLAGITIYLRRQQ